jgi:serine/threonine-protein kinase
MAEEAASPWRAGGRIGPFLLQCPVGQGASAEVWLALAVPEGQAEGGTPVALKALVDEGDEEIRLELRRRFLEESRTAQRLQHPHIVACLDAGESDGRPWMALEWLPGHDLTRYTARQRLLPEPLALQVGACLARALAHAHRLGVVHRDVKPANVRVNLSRRVVKLTDFGVARAEDATRTRTGIVLGTPAYMAPEQLAGAPADARGDLYALAVVLFELLTAHRPHEAASLGELLRQVATMPAPDLRQWRPELPEVLAGVLAKALSRDPSERHADGEQFAAALDAAAQSLSHAHRADLAASGPFAQSALT